MSNSNSVHCDETQPYSLEEIKTAQNPELNVGPDDETIPILIFQHEIKSAPSWWDAAIQKANSSGKWWKWTWLIGFGILSILIMWTYSVHFLNQKTRDVHLIIADSNAFFNTAGGWATLSDMDGIQTQNGILFEDVELGDHKMVIGFGDATCQSVIQRFRLDRGDETLHVPLKRWNCSNTE